MGSNLDIGHFIVFLWISFNDSLPSQFCSPPRGDYSGSIRFDLRDSLDTGICENVLYHTPVISCLKPVFCIHRKRDTDTTFHSGNGRSPVCRYFIKIEPATTFATRLRMETMSPLSSGWTLLVKNMTIVSVSGSMIREVPVYPVWPNAFGPNRSP